MSLLIILWGTRTRDEVRGKVVDLCPSCKSIRPFIIQEHYRADHLYFIPLGGWRKASASRSCTTCGQNFPCVPTRYQKIVPIETADTLSFAELLRQTNSFLAARGPENENAAASQAVAKRPPPTHRGLHEKLESLDEASDERAFLAEELEFWKKLNAAQRENLGTRIDAYYLEQSRLKFARDFLETLARHWPNAIGTTPAMLLIAPTILALIGLFAMVCLVLFFGRNDLAQFLGLYGVAMAVGVFGAVLFYRSSLNATRTAWIRENCTAYAANDGFVDREALARVLDEPVNHDWDPDRIRLVFATRRFKQEILQQLERLPDATEKPRNRAVKQRKSP